MRLRGLRLRGQNDKNLVIFGHFRKVHASKRTKRGVKIVVRKKNCSEKKIIPMTMWTQLGVIIRLFFAHIWLAF